MRRPVGMGVANARRTMSLLSPPLVPRGGAQPPDDLDDLLSAFFKAQMPKTWPAPETPVSRRAAPPLVAGPAKGWPLMRSRLAVAASVALLVGGSLLLAGAFQGRPNGPAGPTIINYKAEALNPDGTPKAPTSPEIHLPAKIKVNESLIQEPNGTTIKVDVIDWPTTPK